ncbi:MAG: Holliday junction DNA helicase RuvA [Pseudohongiellaceae bacterium]|jgi:Holliday junction DNA helicase RuvA
MFEYLTGRLEHTATGEVVIDIGGVGYRLTVSGATLARLPELGQSLTLFTWYVVREEKPALFGFTSREERGLFERLCGVSKVGPGIALSLLSAMTPSALATAIDSGDVAGLSRVKGIGKRTAERLCVELRDRLGALPDLPGVVRDQSAAVIAALMALGFQRRAAAAATSATLKDAEPDAPLDTLIKQSLQRIGSAQATTGRQG